MTLKILLTDLSKPLHQEVYDKVTQLEQDLTKAIDSNSLTHNELGRVRQELIDTKAELKLAKDSPIDEYLSNKYVTVPNIAYKQKRQLTIKQDKTKKEVSGSYDIYLNEMIVPDAFEVQKYKKRFDWSRGLYGGFVKVAEQFTKDNTWVSEPDLYKTGDIYLHPSEVLTFMLKSLDCDDCAHALASLFADHCCVNLGKYIYDRMAYVQDNTKGFFWHAWPAFLDNGSLYIVETTGKTGEVVPVTDKRFEPHLIYTKKKTYRLVDTQFGWLA